MKKSEMVKELEDRIRFNQTTAERESDDESYYKGVADGLQLGLIALLYVTEVDNVKYSGSLSLLLTK